MLDKAALQTLGDATLATLDDASRAARNRQRRKRTVRLKIARA